MSSTPLNSREDALAECRRLREENRSLRKLLAQHGIAEISNGTPKQATSEQPTTSGLLSQESPAKEKIAVFRSLFRGREDVYAFLTDAFCKPRNQYESPIKVKV